MYIPIKVTEYFIFSHIDCLIDSPILDLSKMNLKLPPFVRQCYCQDKCIGGIIYVKKLDSCDSNGIIWFSILSQSLLPSPRKPKDLTSPDETLNVCLYSVCADFTSLAYIWYKL